MLNSNYMFDDSMYGMEEFAFTIIIGILIAYLVLLVFGIASYIMTSLGLYRVAKRRGIQDPWMAWIPFASDWLLGSIADEYDNHNGIKRKWRVLLLSLSIISVVGFVIFYVAFIVVMMIMATSQDFSRMLGMFLGVYGGVLVFAMIATAQGFCKAVCIYKVFESTVPKRAVTYFVLYLLVPLAGPICLLACSKKGYPFPEELAPVQEVPAEVVAEADVVAEAEVVAEPEAVAEEASENNEGETSDSTEENTEE